jgi:hypothetical protein
MLSVDFVSIPMVCQTIQNDFHHFGLGASNVWHACARDVNVWVVERCHCMTSVSERRRDTDLTNSAKIILPDVILSKVALHEA